MSTFLAGIGLDPVLFLELISGICALYLFYLWALPRPLPGIPYNKSASRSLLGDVSTLLKHVSQTQEVFDWLRDQTILHQSPIVQYWGRPFRKPWVLVADFTEAHDAIVRRSKEFDRADFVGDMFTGVLPKHHLSMKTNDEWKQHRRWLQDLMTPNHLHNVAAPGIYTAFQDMISLWTEKSRLAVDHPFSAAKDVYCAALDAVWAAMFSAEPSNSATYAQLQFCASLQTIPLSSDIEDEAVIPSSHNPEVMESIFTLAESVEITLKSPMPRLSHWLFRQMPYMRKAKATKDKFIRDEVTKTEKRFAEAEEREVRCAKDAMIYREILLAEKEGRKPILHSQAMYDEIFGFTIGAHETTSTTINWSLKFLADHPDVQSRLRTELRSTMHEAFSSGRQPLVEEITKSHIPYLDATIEELMRHSGTAAVIPRNAVVDTQILGCRIPKGTAVFFLNNGPSVLSPAFKIDDSLRSPATLSAKTTVGQWDAEDVGIFKPERWLNRDDKGEEVFDATAGPHLTFGLGIRGCFGKRMAYLKMRLVLVMIMWNFELLKCPEKLSTYAAVDGLTHAPAQCYVRLRKAV